MKIKRILALLLAAVLVLSLAGCGISRKYKKTEDGMTVYYFGDDEDIKNFPDVADTLNPQAVYDSLEYNEEMFYGYYSYEGKVEDIGKFSGLISVDYVKSVTGEVTSEEFFEFPIRIEMGNRSSGGRRNREHEWADLLMRMEDGNTRYVTCTYAVSGNTITFTPVAKYELQYDEEYRATGLLYELGTQALTYTFSFRGPELTLSREGKSITLCALNFQKDSTSVGFFGQASPNAPSLPDIQSISAHIYGGGLKQLADAYMLDIGNYGDEGYVYMGNETFRYREDGLLTMTWYQEDEGGKDVLHTRQFVAFVGDGLILADGENVYYYNHSEDTYVLETVSQGMTEDEQLMLAEMEEAKLEAIVEKKADLLADLSAAFVEAGLTVHINEATGEIALDSTILFDYDKSEVKQEGREQLAKFMQVYTSVVYNEKYNGFISRILVEGHTDTNGTYEYNQTLSQARADAVRDFCLSDEAGVDSAYRQLLADALSAVGYSWDYPVYAEDGSVDMDASRRVAFRFIVNLNQ